MSVENVVQIQIVEDFGDKISEYEAEVNDWLKRLQERGKEIISITPNIVFMKESFGTSLHRECTIVYKG